MHGVVTEEDFELVNTGNLKEAAEVLNKKKGKEKHRGLNTAETLLYVRSGNHQPAPASLDQRAGGIASTRPGTGTKPSTPGLLQRKYSSSGSVGTRRGSTMLDGAAKRRDFESSPRSSTWSLPAEE